MKGVLVVDKPKGLTSAKVVESIKKCLKINKAGHTGTLDPFATGVLPVALNKSTKLIPFFNEDYKEYEGLIHLGIATDTFDSTGKVVSKSYVGKIKESDILETFSKYIGIVKQLPPMYSAIKQNGVRLFKLARLGKEVEREPRNIHIEKLEIINYDFPYITFFVRCSKGTYIRTLASDIGEYLGCGAHLKKLRRISSGSFHLSDSFTLEDIKEGNYRLLENNFLLKHLKSVSVSSDKAEKIKNGVKIVKDFIADATLPDFEKGEKIVIRYDNSFLAVAESLVSSEKFEEINSDGVVLKVLRVII